MPLSWWEKRYITCLFGILWTGGRAQLVGMAVVQALNQKIPVVFQVKLKALVDLTVDI